MVIIGIYSSLPGMGKTTIARWLQRNHGFHIVSFAAPIKNMARALLESAGYKQEEISRYMKNPEVKNTEVIPGVGCTMRHLLQTLGTDWGREEVHTDLWVNIALQKCKSIGGNVCIDDMRFPNEYDILKDEEAALIRVLREVEDHSNEHASERRLDYRQFDYIIDNFGDIPALYETLERIFPPNFFRVGNQ